jgi:formimidoylglutamate deiminase
MTRELWAPQAWVRGRWQAGVRLAVDAAGRWQRVECGVAAPPPGAEVLVGLVLPGLVDAHSHAFQRAFAGLAERREGGHDDFWSWRERMYRVALAVGPEPLRAVAAQLYVELLHGGYTEVCEFHYLHRAPDGSAYADPLTLAWALADAAADAGIGLTLLPVLYERAGFAADGLRPEQRRFAAGADEVLAMHAALRAAARPNLGAGLAIHSLRAARPASIARLAARAGEGPVHVHVAEQTAEVDDCLAATGLRPIEWLARHAPLDARWQLVHATHATPAEIDAVSASGAGVVFCPTTEADLGDGLPDLPRWLAACRSARTARSGATGQPSCGCWNTASACCAASATSPRRPSRAGPTPRRGCSSACSPAARRLRVGAPGASRSVRAPTCWSSMRPTRRAWACRRSVRSMRSCSRRRGAASPT